MKSPLKRLLPPLIAFVLAANPSFSDPGFNEGAFAARAANLLDFLANDWTDTPFPNFSNVHMHYWAAGIARIARSPEGVRDPQLNEGDAESTRPPRYWGILRYDGEPAHGELKTDRGAGPHTSFSWNENVFHFLFPGLASLIGMHPDIPTWSTPHHRDPSLTYRENYLRYVLRRTDNYNAFTGEGTENHINMSRPSAWVLASEADRLGLSFPGQPFAAAERKAQMKEWMRAWAKRIYEVGIGEWDSGIYHMVSLQGWFVAHDYAGTERGWDPEVRAAARAVLDHYASALALKHHGFQMAGAEKRTGRRFDGMHNGTAYLAYLWFGEGENPPSRRWRGGDAAEAVFAAVSDYRPPPGLLELARKTANDNETYHNLKPSYILKMPGQGVEVLHLGPGYVLGSANIAIGGFHSTVWQILPWKLSIHPSDDGIFPAGVVTGNGGFLGLDRNHTRDPWMQLVQHKNVLFQLHTVPENAEAIVAEVHELSREWRARWYEDFTARWKNPDWGGFSGETYRGRPTPLRFLGQNGSVENARSAFLNYPAGTEIATRDGVHFAQFAGVYWALRPVREETLAHNPERRALSDTGEPGELFGFVMEVGAEAEHGSFSEFQERILASTTLDFSERDSKARVTYRSLAGDKIQVTYAESGSWVEPDYDGNFGVRRPGGVALMHAAAWQQPDWPTGQGHGRQPAWSVNGTAIDPATWAVFEGPRLRLRDSRLEVKQGGVPVYTVDFSGEWPVFGPESQADGDGPSVDR